MTHLKALYHYVPNDLHYMATEACKQMARLLQRCQNQIGIRYWLILRAGKNAQIITNDEFFFIYTEQTFGGQSQDQRKKHWRPVNKSL